MNISDRHKIISAIFVALLLCCIPVIGYEINKNKITLFFTENSGETDERIKYYADTPEYRAYFQDDSVILRFNDKDSLKISFNGAESVPEGISPMRGEFNFITGNNPDLWRAGINTFKEISYRNIYQNIDLLYSGTSNGLKSTYVCNPGSDIQEISFIYDGINTEISDDGSLTINTFTGTLVEKKPVSWQNYPDGKKYIPVNYRINKDGTIGFQANNYDPKIPLYIDPEYSYSTFFGGSGSDDAAFVAVDDEGCAYIAGSTSSSDLPVLSAFNSTLAGNKDIFVTKFSSDGSEIIYSTYVGGSGYDLARGIAIDSSGCAYVHGQTASEDFPVTSGAYDTTYNGGSTDCFTFKLSSDGSSLDYSSFIGGSDFDYGKSITVDSSGNTYFTGRTGSDDFPTTPGVLAENSQGSSDAYVSKFNSNGSLVYSTYLGGGLIDQGSGIIVDSSGNAYITGYTISSDFPTTTGAYQTEDPSFSRDSSFVCKINPTATNFVWSTYLASPNEDHGCGIVIDSSGYPYIVGYIRTGDFPTTAGAYQTVFGGDYDAYVTKMSSSGDSLEWSTLLGGNGRDFGYEITLDNEERVFVTGSTSDINNVGNNTFPVLNTLKDYADNYDVFVSVIEPGGAELNFSTFIGGNGADNGIGIDLGPDGRVFVTGSTESGGILNAPDSYKFPVTSGAYQEDLAGNYDAYVTAINMNSLPDAPVCSFTANATNTTAPCIVEFTDTSTNTPTAWNWSFGDGILSDIQNPVHNYTVSGNYTVSLTVSNDGGSGTETKADFIIITVRGDFNGNGIVDIGDVSKVAYMVAGIIPKDPEADFNDSGIVDIGDASKIAWYYVGLIDSL